jgi:hypothetical protein
MRPENIALRRDAQGKIALYSLEVAADELDQDECPVEVISISEGLECYLRLLRLVLRGGRVRVFRVFPCPSCGAPIAVLRLETERVLRVCDAVEEPNCPELWRDGKTPDWYKKPWTANVFAMHECPEQQ